MSQSRKKNTKVVKTLERAVGQGTAAQIHSKISKALSDQFTCNVAICRKMEKRVNFLGGRNEGKRNKANQLLATSKAQQRSTKKREKRKTRAESLREGEEAGEQDQEFRHTYNPLQ